MAASLKEMTSDFVKLEKFNGGNFIRWQKKMKFLLTTLKVAYVLNMARPEDKDDETVAETRDRQKWDNDDYICLGHILNGMSDSLFDIYQSSPSAKDLWDKLETRYMREDATNFKRTMKHKKEDISLEQLGNHLRLEEEYRKQEGIKNHVT